MTCTCEKHHLHFLCYCTQNAHTCFMKIGTSGKGNAHFIRKTAINHSVVQRLLFVCLFVFICWFCRWILTFACQYVYDHDHSCCLMWCIQHQKFAFFPSLAHYSTKHYTGLWCWVDWIRVRCYQHQEMMKAEPGLSLTQIPSHIRSEIPEMFIFWMSQLLYMCETLIFTFRWLSLNHHCIIHVLVMDCLVYVYNLVPFLTSSL